MALLDMTPGWVGCDLQACMGGGGGGGCACSRLPQCLLLGILWVDGTYAWVFVTLTPLPSPTPHPTLHTFPSSPPLPPLPLPLATTCPHLVLLFPPHLARVGTETFYLPSPCPTAHSSLPHCFTGFLPACPCPFWLDTHLLFLGLGLISWVFLPSPTMSLPLPASNSSISLRLGCLWQHSVLDRQTCTSTLWPSNTMAVGR